LLESVERWSAIATAVGFNNQAAEECTRTRNEDADVLLILPATLVNGADIVEFGFKAGDGIKHPEPVAREFNYQGAFLDLIWLQPRHHLEVVHSQNSSCLALDEKSMADNGERFAKGIPFRFNFPGLGSKETLCGKVRTVQIQVRARKRAVLLEFRFFLFEYFSPKIDRLASHKQRRGLPLVEYSQQVEVISEASLESGACTHHSLRPP